MTKMMGKYVFLLFIVLFTLSVPVVSFSAINDNLTVYYSFDNTTKQWYEDLTATGFNIINFANSNTTNTTGKIGSARNISGTGYLLTLNDTRIFPATDSGYGAIQRGYTIVWWSVATNTVGSQYHVYAGNGANIVPAAYFANAGTDVRTFQRGGSAGADLTTSAVTSNVWQFNAITVDLFANTFNYSRNAVNQGSGSTTGSTLAAGYSIIIGAYFDGGSKMSGPIDEFGIWNRTLTPQELSYLYNSGNGRSCAEINCSIAPVVTYGNATIGAKDYYLNTFISNFSVYENQSVLICQTTNGTCNLPYRTNTSSLFNLMVTSDQTPGFYNVSYTNQNISSLINASMFRTYITSTTFGGNYSYNATHSLVRNLTFAVVVGTCSQNGTLGGFVNGSNLFNVSFACNQLQNITVNGSYQNAIEANYNLAFRVFETYSNVSRLGNTLTNTSVWNFTQDLNAPQVFINYSYNDGFVTNLTVNTSLRCLDTYSFFNLSYNLTDNGASLIYNASVPNNYTLNASGLLNDGVNTLVGVCADIFGSNTSTVTFTTYAKSFFIINELTGVPFSLSNVNVTYVRLWFGDNSTYYDFKTANVTNISLRSSNVTNFRLEVGYTGGAVPIVSYLEISYIPEANVLLCAKDPGVLTYQQLIISTTQQFAGLKNAFTNCYVAADITRFAYQDAFLLQAITANSKYYLYTFTNGSQVYLAAVDGSIATYINLETIIFSSEQATESVIGDGFTASKTANNTFAVRYQNVGNNIDTATLTISRLDTGAVISVINSFADPDNWTLVFNYASLTGVNESTVFKLSYVYDIGGATYSRTIYLSPNSTSPGVLPSGFAFGLSLMILIFGLTITSVRITFGWFGILIVLAAIVIAGLGTSIWYLNFLMAMEVIALVFMVIYLSRVNWQQVV